MRPPLPRRDTKRSLDRSKTYGPRWEQTTNLFADKIRKQSEPIGDLSRRQEVFADELPSRFAHLAGAVRILEQLERALRAFLRRVDEISGSPVLDLQRDATRASADH